MLGISPRSKRGLAEAARGASSGEKRPRVSGSGARAFVVTGGSSGVGLAICRRLLSEPGVQVFLGCRDMKKGREAAAQLLAPERCRAVLLDVADAACVERAAKEVQAIAPEGLAGLVNNAGVAFDLPWYRGEGGRLGNQQVPPEAASRTLDCNFLGVLKVVSAFRHLLRADASIVNVSSGAGALNMKRMSEERRVALLPESDDGLGRLEAMAEDFIRVFEAAGEAEHGAQAEGYWLQAYGFSKALLNAAGRVLAQELAPVRVNSATPGFIRTAMTQDFPQAETLKSPEQGAEVIVQVLLEAQATGRYFAPGPDAPAAEVSGGTSLVEKPWVAE